MRIKASKIIALGTALLIGRTMLVERTDGQRKRQRGQGQGQGQRGKGQDQMPIAGQNTMTWNIDGVQRKALVFAPTTPGSRHPLIFAFHAHGGHMEGAAQAMHLQSMHQKFSVDDARVYSSGFSNGANFTYLLWAVRGNIIAAIGECAGRFFPAVNPTQARAVLANAGKNDQVDPFPSQEQSIQTDRQVDNATGTRQACGQYCTLYASTTHTPVETFIHPGGHVYPDWAPAAIVAFLKLHKL